MKLNFGKIMGVFAVLLCISGCTNKTVISDENIQNNLNDTTKIINETNDDTEQELIFPQINRWKTVDYGQGWPDLMIELQNNNEDTIDVNFDIEYFDEQGNSLGKSEGLYYIALRPQEKGLIRSSWNIPSAADIKVTPTYIARSTYNSDVSYKISKNEKIGNAVDLDFDIDGDMSNASVYIVFYNGDNVATVYSYGFFDKADSYHRCESTENFDHYEVYANIY